MGISDNAYMAWLIAALARYERATGGITAKQRRDLLVIGGGRSNRAIEWVQKTMSDDATICYWDLYERGSTVEIVDFNNLTLKPDHICDIIMMTRASYLLKNLDDFLSHARRLLRPHGLMMIDWLYGSAEVSCRGVRGVHHYNNDTQPFVTTYDGQIVAKHFTVAWGEVADLFPATGKHYLYFLTILTC